MKLCLQSLCLTASNNSASIVTMTIKSSIPIKLLAFIIIVISQISTFSKCQFISHINSKGLRGNITFDVIQETSNKSVLVIESIIETNQLIQLAESDNEQLDGLHQEISFDWSVHSNTLQPYMLATCSNDDLGSEKLRKSLTENRPIIANKLNHWTIPLAEFLDSNSAASLSSLLWGKSIRLKLSEFYNEKPPPNQSRSQPSLFPSSLSSASSSSLHASQSPSPTFSNSTSPGARAKAIVSIVKPRAGTAIAATSSPPSKPTFAPRPKPTILGRHKVASSQHIVVTPPILPKPEALVLETNNFTMKISPTIQSTTNTTITESSLRDSENTTQIVKNTTNKLTANKKAINKLIFKTWGTTVVCGSIIDTRNVKTAEAIFESPSIGGKVTIRGNEDDTTLLMINLYHIKSKVTTRHDWKILASDIWDNRQPVEQCKYLQILFDPNDVEDSNCSRTDMTKCRMGDLTEKHGQVQIAGQSKSTRMTLVDSNLPVSALESSRALFLVIYEVQAIVTKLPVDQSSLATGQVSKQANILTCAQIKPVGARKAEATFNMDGVRGFIRWSQRHFTEPTVVTYDLYGLEGNIKHLTIRELPLMARSSSDNSDLCTKLGNIFSPNKLSTSYDSNKNQPLFPTVDAFEVGNLSAKHGQLMVIDSEYEDHYMGEYIDLSIQLYGSNTIVGRSVVIHKNNGDNWVCATIDYVDAPISIAVATFHYPVVGKITFQQLADNPNSETGVLVEVYNPNSVKSSDGHNWMVHLSPAMADFYNWSQRCESSGEVYDPLQAATGLNSDLYNRQCQSGALNEPLRCRSGDLGLKSNFKLTLSNSHSTKLRFYYTDLFLPLSKLNSIIGRSVVIYDEHAPVQRGNRLACSTIKSVHPLKAVIKRWNSGPSIPSAVLGKIEFEQTSAERTTQIKIDLVGLNGSVENYAIHHVWTMDDREFPCSNDSLYDIYDPYNNENSLRLPPSAHYGSLATVDRVKVGDMSRKHGTFEGLQKVQKTYLDSNAPLFAPQSIIGRSLVLRASANDFRWICGNIELDYNPDESREIIGLASFDEPRSKISGYVRFVQIEHKDGSLSDTYVQVDLRMQSDGVHELETSESHNWAIFVNQVGEDAYIAADEVRCIAAGFKWNPYLAQDTSDSYINSCNSGEQHACAMGDLGLRHGSLTLGPNYRRSLSDSNLPLTGNYSVMGRSLVIFDNKKPTVKLACANIFPDIHLKSNVVIKRTPSFTVARFVEQMRSLLGAAEWLMLPELGATKPVANGECVQMTIHFYGQKAHQMQVELNNLINFGTVRKSTRTGVDKISTHYKLC